MDILPPELNCMILSNVTDVFDIVNYMMVSRNFRSAARHCVKKLTSNNIVEVPISNFANFLILEKIDSNILLTDTDQFETIKTIPRLKSATLYLRHVNDLRVLVEVVTTLLLNIDFDVIKIIAYYHDLPVGFILQGNRFMIMGLTDGNYNFDHMFGEIQRFYPNLLLVPTEYIIPMNEGINYINIFQHFPEPLFMKRKLIKFLQETDFGLLYPNQSPSPNNPPLSNYAKIIANLAIDSYDDDYNITRLLFEVYLLYNQIINFNDIDSHLIEEPLNYEDNFWTIIKESVFIDNPSLQDIIDFDIPKLVGLDYCITLPNIIKTTLDIYDELFDTTKAFYTTRGDIRHISHYARFAD